MYKATRDFIDLKDKDFRYKEGDVYPRKGYKPSESRISELAGNHNLMRVPLIEKIEVKKADGEE